MVSNLTPYLNGIYKYPNLLDFFIEIRCVGGAYVARLKRAIKKRMEIEKQKSAERQMNEGILNSLASISVSDQYVSDDPVSLIDTNIREYGHLTRINDSAATLFYHIHGAVKPHLMKGIVTRQTPNNAEKAVLNNKKLLDMLNATFPNHSQQIFEGKIKSIECL